MRSVHIRLVPVLLLCLASTWGVSGLARADEGTSPAVATVTKTPQEAAIAAGQLRFNRNCVYCHGSAGAGGKGLPLQGRDDLTAEYLFTTIVNGKKRGSLVMPAWRDAFTDVEVNELATYILSLRDVHTKR